MKSDIECAKEVTGYIVLNCDNQFVKGFQKRSDLINWWIDQYKKYILDNEDLVEELERTNDTIIERAINIFHENENYQEYTCMPYWIYVELG